ncbi:hypothetical protein [Maledivibacter halophilus]|uniref:Uncharacterized protein n=1 Tax=Maledivibacter halophilus TaxID=36842 RepID=A0A1T5M1K2_9FIRM|nr:hypothetical protein [Maledivibacter halophilus]SKC82141.1 hypothetical protein SAMN02194393_03713 [Maledivibacter halophilus]
MKNSANTIKKFWRWIIGYEDTLIETICEAFTIITVINSYMMISGLDKPKIGRFTYIHLLIRLTIISTVCVIWDYEDAFQSIKKYITKMKNIKGIAKINIKKIYKNVLENKYNSICVIYTFIIVSICLVMALGPYVPKGGVKLYFNLILLFAFISITILFLYILEKIKTLFHKNPRL